MQTSSSASSLSKYSLANVVGTVSSIIICSGKSLKEHVISTASSPQCMFRSLISSFEALKKVLRASKIVDELVVGVLCNSAKNPLFSLDERVSMIEEMTKHQPNVTVQAFDGLLVDYMNKIGATLIVRGLRAVTDFEYELQIAQTNHVQNENIETIFLTTNLNYSYLSSTIVKEFASYGGDISKFVPEQFIEQIYAKYNIRK